MGYFTKEVGPAVNYTNHSHSELRLGMEWIGPKWLPLILPADHRPFILALLHSILTRRHTQDKMSNQKGVPPPLNKKR